MKTNKFFGFALILMLVVNLIFNIINYQNYVDIQFITSKTGKENITEEKLRDFPEKFKEMIKEDDDILKIIIKEINDYQIKK